MWSFEKLFGESFSSGDERKQTLDVKKRKENVYREMDKVWSVPHSGTSIL